MSVLIDTSKWVAHFRRRNEALVEPIERDSAATHPIVPHELACGTPPAPRARTLHDLGLLPSVKHATLSEVMALIEREELYGPRCGLVNMTLVASTLITPGAAMSTQSMRLAELARRFDVAHPTD